MKNKDFEEEIIKIIKSSFNPVWISELQRELIRRGYDISTPKLSNILKSMEERELITTETMGVNKIIKLRK